MKRRRRNWDWLQIKSHRDCLKTYRKAYQTKLSSSKPASDVVKQCTKLEQQLDALNIVLVRQQVEFEVSFILSLVYVLCKIWDSLFC